jgi:hypothetical protein
MPHSRMALFVVWTGGREVMSLCSEFFFRVRICSDVFSQAAVVWAFFRRTGNLGFSVDARSSLLQVLPMLSVSRSLWTARSYVGGEILYSHSRPSIIAGVVASSGTLPGSKQVAFPDTSKARP